METWRDAFSIRRNIGLLVTPPVSRLNPVDGFRALAVLWIMVMHCIWFQMPFLTGAEWSRRIDEAPAWIIGGPFGVDVFFVISGFLIGCILMGEHGRRGTIDVKEFYLRRFLKLMPAYFASLAIYAALGGVNPDMIWANVLYVNNFVPGERQAMVWSWSLAIEEQFYFTFPCFLLFVFYRVRHRLALLVGLLAGATGLSALVLLWLDVRAPVPWALGVYDQRFLDWAEGVYIKPYTRFGCLVCGVIAAHLHLTRDLWKPFRRYPRTAAAGAVLATAVIAAVIAAPAHVTSPAWSAWSSLAFLSTYRNLLGAATAYLLLYCLYPTHAIGRALSRLLSLRPWYAIAQLAYSMYLLHPIIYVLVYGMVGAETIGSSGMLPFYLVLPAIALIGSVPLYLLVERPFMNLREVVWRPAAARPRSVSQPTSASISSSVVR